MNVVRSNIYSRQVQQSQTRRLRPMVTRPSLISARSVNFRVRNYGPAAEIWHSTVSRGKSGTTDRTPLRSSGTSSTSCHTSNKLILPARQNSATVRTSTKSASTNSRPHPTPSTLRTPRSVIAEPENNCIIALAEGRGHARGEVGLAAIDVKRPYLYLCQLSDSQTYTNTLAKINVFNPLEVLLPSTFCEGAQPNKLLESIREQYPQLTVTTIQRRHFSDTTGLMLIQKLCVPQCANVERLVSQRFYALAATAALLKYVEFIQNTVFAPHSLRIEYQGSNNTMLIDVNTAERLELVRGAISGVSSVSLFSTLNLCRTVGGSRLLRSSLLQPSCLLEEIERRLVCVQELVDTPILYHNLQAALTKFADCEQLLSLSMAAPTTGAAAVRHATYQLNYVLLLKSCLGSLPQLLEALVDAQAPAFCEVKTKLEDPAFEVLKEYVVKTLHDDAHAEKGFTASNLQRCFAVRAGINGLLDIARKTYCELVDSITTHVNRYKEDFGLPLRVGWSATRGFHIQLPISGLRFRQQNFEIPPIFIQVQKTKTLITMTTQELVHTDQRCKEALNEIQTMSNIVLSELLTETRRHAGSLYQLCETVSQLDVILCLAGVSAIPGYVRPTFGDKLDVRGSQHPILTFILHKEPVANAIFASESRNFNIITGPNMGGKSVYLKQVALLQILAQIGCFVPAESAIFRITDRIFSRIGFDDSMESNASTFTLEIREMVLMLNNVTSRSLLIVDELCRSTSCEEGTALAWALCEQLLNTKAFIFFTTHFQFLTKLQDLYPNVTNYHMEAEEVTTDVINENSHHEIDRVDTVLRYTHRLLPGVTRLEHYGMKLAKLSGIPKSVLNRAEVFLKKLIEQRKPVGDGVECSKEQKLETDLASLWLSVQEAAEKYGPNFQDFVQRCRELQSKFFIEHPDYQNEKLETSNNETSHATHSSINNFPTQETVRNVEHTLVASQSVISHFITSQPINEKSQDVCGSFKEQENLTNKCNQRSSSHITSQILENNSCIISKNTNVEYNSQLLNTQAVEITTLPASILTIRQQYSFNSDDISEHTPDHLNTIDDDLNRVDDKETISKSQQQHEAGNQDANIELSNLHEVTAHSISPTYSPLSNKPTSPEIVHEKPISEHNFPKYDTQHQSSQTFDIESYPANPMHDNESPNSERNTIESHSPSYSPIHDEVLSYKNSPVVFKTNECETSYELEQDTALFKYPPISKSHLKQQNVFQNPFSDTNKSLNFIWNLSSPEKFGSAFPAFCSVSSLRNEPTKCNESGMITNMSFPTSFTPAKNLLSNETLLSLATSPSVVTEPCEAAATPELYKAPDLPPQCSPIIRSIRRRRGAMSGLRSRFVVPIKTPFTDMNQHKN